MLCACPEPAADLSPMLDTGDDRFADMKILGDADFSLIRDHALTLAPDLVIGNSKGSRIAFELNVPHVRVGFPVHDRFGAARLLHVGYRGAQQLFDRVVNALLEAKQRSNDIGYSYL